MRGEDVHVPRPHTCPGCKENWMQGTLGPSIDPYGPISLFCIDDTEDGYNKILLKGWKCEGIIFGTIIAHSTSEDPENIQDIPPVPNCTFIEKIGKRKVWSTPYS